MSAPKQKDAHKRAARLRTSVETCIASRDFKDGYHEGIRDLIDELYPRCPECGRPDDEGDAA